MLQITDIQTILAENFFAGNTVIAGLVIFVAVLMVIFSISKNLLASFLIALPVILIFSTLGIISGDMMILLIIITVLGLAITAKSSLG